MNTLKRLSVTKSQGIRETPQTKGKLTTLKFGAYLWMALEGEVFPPFGREFTLAPDFDYEFRPNPDKFMKDILKEFADCTRVTMSYCYYSQHEEDRKTIQLSVEGFKKDTYVVWFEAYFDTKGRVCAVNGRRVED